jgi:hypothetical protein
MAAWIFRNKPVHLNKALRQDGKFNYPLCGGTKKNAITKITTFKTEKL